MFSGRAIMLSSEVLIHVILFQLVNITDVLRRNEVRVVEDAPIPEVHILITFTVHMRMSVTHPKEIRITETPQEQQANAVAAQDVQGNPNM